MKIPPSPGRDSARIALLPSSAKQRSAPRCSRGAFALWSVLGLLWACGGGPAAYADYWAPDPSFNVVVEGSIDRGFVVPALACPDGGALIPSTTLIVNGTRRPWLTRLRHDGSTDVSFAPAFEHASVLAVYPDGRILFSTQNVGQYVTYTIRRMLANGSEDPSYVPVDVDNGFQATLIPDGRVVIYGMFSRVGSLPRVALARILADGGVDETFQSPLQTQYAYFTAVLPVEDGKLLLAGGLQLGAGHNSLARLNQDGSVDSTFVVDDTLLGGTVRWVARRSDGSLNVYDQTYHVRHLSRDGVWDDSFQPILNGNEIGFVADPAHGRIYGLFDSAESVVVRRFHDDFTADPAFVPLTLPNHLGSQYPLPVVMADGGIVVGPATVERAQQGHSLTLVSSAGVVDANFNPRFSHEAETTGHIRLPDGKELISGAFDYVNGTQVGGGARFSLVRLMPDGSLDATFAASLPGNSGLSNLCRQPDGHILGSGFFQRPDGSYLTLVRFAADGQVDTSFPQFSEQVMGLSVDSSGRIFVTLGSAPGLKRLNADGTPDATFSMAAPASPLAVAPLAGGKVLLALREASEYALVRLRADGSADPAFQTVHDFTKFVGLAALPDGSAVLCTSRLMGDGRYVAEARRIPADAPSTGLVPSDASYTTAALNATWMFLDQQLDFAGVIYDWFRAATASDVATLPVAMGSAPTGMDIDLSGSGGMSLHLLNPYATHGQIRRFVRVAGPAPDSRAPNFTLPLTFMNTSLLPQHWPLFLYASVSGSGPFTFQWYKDGVLIPGKTEASLTVINLSAADAGNYTVTATNVYGTAASSATTVGVDPDHSVPFIITEPSDQAVGPGTTVSFSVVAGGSPSPSFQWFFNGAPISGANDATLTLPNVTVAAAGSYYVTVANSVQNAAGSYGTSASSAIAHLAVGEFNGATFLAQNSPTKAVAGRWMELQVSLSNSGSKPWGANHFVVLRDPQGNWLGSASLAGTAVGANISVVLSFRVPADLGAHQFQLQVVENGLEWVGAPLVLPCEITGPERIVDFNSDGAPDLLLENSITGQRVLWLMGGPNNAFVTQGLDLGFLDAAWRMVGTADFNTDGAPDILLENASSGQRVLWLMGGPNNAYVSQGLDLGYLDPAWHIAGTADFNADGSPDILLENASSGQRVLWLMGGPNNAYVTQGLDLGVLDPAWHIVGLADFNGDSAPDILLENVSTGQRVLWLMGGPNNAYVTQGIDLGVLAPVWHIVKTVDFNADGAPDILLENASTGQRVLWLMGGPNGAYVTQGLDLGFLPAEWRIVK